MKPSPILTMLGRDLLGVIVLAAIALAAGILMNEFREHPLPLTYASKAERLEKAVAKVQAAQQALVTATPPPLAADTPTARLVSSTPSVPTPAPATVQVREIDLDEFRRLLDEPQSLVVDARPEIFHRLGHIPHALALPRDDFDTYYEKHRATLEANKGRPLLIYCQGSSCEDSHLVATALSRLGYAQLAVFAGGWNQWSQLHLPEEK